MRVFVLNTNYLRFLSRIYREHSGLEQASYGEQSGVLEEILLTDSASYARAFETFGHVAAVGWANNAPLQMAWAKEHGHASLAQAVERRRVAVSPRAIVRRKVGWRRHSPPAVLRGEEGVEPLVNILLAQIEAFRPDIVLNQDMFLIDRSTLRQIKNLGIRIVGQHAASPLPATTPLDEYDLLVSSFPPTVDALRSSGVPTRLNRLAFDPCVLRRFSPRPAPIRWHVTFVGSLQSVHSSRLEFLEELATLVPTLRIWTPDTTVLRRRSPLRSRVMGSAFGWEMYEILRSSFATVNHHGDVAPYANNSRLFEATGIGTLLLTDSRVNLTDLFTPGVEVLVHSSASSCAEMINGIAHLERDDIAIAGQRRTLAEHTYLARVRELLGLFEDMGV